MLQEIQEWMEAYTTVLYRRTVRDMERLMVVFNLLDRKLDRKIRDLEDTRISMECLRDIRIQEVEFEMAIELVEVHFCSYKYSQLKFNSLNINRKRSEL